MPFDPIDLESLLAPIPGDDPAGSSGVFQEIDELQSIRKAISSGVWPNGEPVNAEREWNNIVNKAISTLEKKSKHLKIAVRLVDALARRDGFAGLDEGLKTLKSLVDVCWDRMYPELDPTDPSVRADPFEFLNDQKAGALLPYFVRAMPLLSTLEGDFSFLDLTEKKPTGDDRALNAAFEERSKKAKKAIEQVTRKQGEVVENHIVESISSINSLVSILNDKIGRNDAPSMRNLLDALEDCQRQMQSILKDKPGAPSPVHTPTPEPGPVGTPGDPMPQPQPNTVLTRASVYQRLSEAADQLQEMEPHSPIPYLIKRAVDLGAMPFPVLMKALIANPQVLDDLQKGLGIKDPT